MRGGYRTSFLAKSHLLTSKGRKNGVAQLFQGTPSSVDREVDPHEGLFLIHELGLKRIAAADPTCMGSWSIRQPVHVQKY